LIQKCNDYNDGSRGIIWGNLDGGECARNEPKGEFREGIPPRKNANNVQKKFGANFCHNLVQTSVVVFEYYCLVSVVFKTKSKIYTIFYKKFALYASV